MGAQEKRIETFFTKQGGAKRARVGGEASSSAPAGVAAAADGPVAEAFPPAAAASPPLLTAPEDLHTAQLIEMQQLRAHANRNNALAKQVVIRAEQGGTLPSLSDLLVEESWRALLAKQLQKNEFKELEGYVQSEWAAGRLIFPPKDAIFKAFNSCPVDKVRVVILGQDPYHTLGQAMGLSFSVPLGKPVPSSLRNMYKELRDDLGCVPAKHGCLETWSDQGVLLLNAVLTVRSAAPASHAKRGWEHVTDEAISRLSKERSGLVFLLWGKYAQARGRHIDRTKHHVLEAAHPSGLSASRGFFGCRHFSKANELLQSDGHLPIDWCVG